MHANETVISFNMNGARGFRILALLVLGLAMAGSRVGAQNRLALSVTGPTNRDVITGSLTYAIKVANLSASPALDVRVTDPLPADVQFLSATNSYARSPATLTNGTNVVFSFPRINGSEVAQMTLTVLPTAVGSITNTVSLSADGMSDVITAISRFEVLSIQVSIHDPAMAKEGDTYYLFSSGPGITFYSSKDMTHWELRGPRVPGRAVLGEGRGQAF